MSDWTRVADLTELSRRKKKLVILDEERVALFYDNGEVFAFRDACVHKGKSLSRGTVLNGRLICPGHQWAFDLRTGRADDREECQPGFAVHVVDGRVWLRSTTPPATAAPQPGATAAASATPATGTTTQE